MNEALAETTIESERSVATNYASTLGDHISAAPLHAKQLLPCLLVQVWAKQGGLPAAHGGHRVQPLVHPLRPRLHLRPPRPPHPSAIVKAQIIWSLSFNVTRMSHSVTAGSHAGLR